MSGRVKIRRPKSEGRKKFADIGIRKVARFAVLFGFWTSFGFRASDFGFPQPCLRCLRRGLGDFAPQSISNGFHRSNRHFRLEHKLRGQQFSPNSSRSNVPFPCRLYAGPHDFVGFRRQRRRHALWASLNLVKLSRSRHKADFQLHWLFARLERVNGKHRLGCRIGFGC